MSFSALPTEILEFIVFQIEDRKTLGSFGLTCKQFHEVANTKITSQQYERFADASSTIEAKYPWQFLLASHKARQIGDWAFSPYEKDRAAQLSVAIQSGSERLAEFAVDKLGLTHSDMILERTFYHTLYSPLMHHIGFLLDRSSKSSPELESLDETLLNTAQFIDIMHHPFTSSLQIAMNDDNLKSAKARRRSLGQPQYSEFGFQFLKMGTMGEDPFTQVNRLTRLLTERLKGIPWPTWNRRTNGSDIVPHIYGLTGILSLSQGR